MEQREANDYRLAEELELAPALTAGLSLAEACSRAEDRLVNHLSSVVCEAVVDTEEDAWPLALDRFVLDNTTYDVRSGGDITDANALQIVIGEVGSRWATEQFDRHTITVHGAGRYTSVAFSADPRLSGMVETIGECIQNYLADGYRRLRANVERALLEADNRIAIRLYAEVRSVFDEDVASRISLYAIVEGREALYLLDPPNILEALQRASNHRPSAAASPLTLTALLVQGSVPADETVAMQTIEHKGPVAVRLADLYYATAPEYNLAELSFYGDTAQIQPIVRDGRVRLLAGYPTEVRDLAEPGLDRLKGRLTEIVHDYERAVVRLAERKHEPLSLHRHWDGYITSLVNGVLRRSNKGEQ